MSSKEFCAKNKRKIKKINYYLSKINIDKVIDRFILCGNMSSYRIDGIIYGTGVGTSKKEAEQEAAKDALDKLATLD